MAVSPDLLEILRCPYCVSGPTRKAGDDPGRLELVKGTWLVCQEPDCGRKYPIKEDIPVMLIEEGDKWIDTPVSELAADPGPLVEPTEYVPVPRPSDFGTSRQGYDRQRLALLLLSILGVSILIAGLVYLLRPSDSSDA
ncbi:MAG: hypothetical protein FOGNACKC_02120 [Anaerolineae bacterium]|nr:hypothetical protein [Anaerolineae bacterium]